MPHQFGVPQEIIDKVYARELGIEAFSPYLSPIHDRHVIGVNAAFLLGRWIDIVCWGDGSFYWKNKDELLKFRGLKVSFNHNTTNRRPGVVDVKYVERDNRHLMGLSTNRNMQVSWNKNTGAAAVNLAYHLGVKRVLLLGFDMSVNENRQQHWHAHYPSALKPRADRLLPFQKHLQSFKYISNDLQKIKGFEILNVNVDSNIPFFKKVRLEEVL